MADLELIASLGIRALRYPVLWERVAPDGLADADWSWTDERLPRLAELGVRPIAGLVHHGSGPSDTNLLDPAFPQKLAAYARGVAERYPWLTEYTPINEPLTTARFSGLYGHWYPHKRDELTFARVVLLECRAVVEAMRAIRVVNPGAQLIQTDDLGKTYSTPRLRYQAAFENERRWLSWDLLSGVVDVGHPMWSYLLRLGLDEAALAWFLENPCPPNVLGINHYVTSERLLDESRELYPPDRWGGNAHDTYADMEAARVRAEGIDGWRVLVREAWERYGLPVALTEVHLASTREEQLRWLLEAWTTCEAVRTEIGADIRAVTAWSLFGAFDWNHLVTCAHDFYEPGVFDLRSPQPRPTALADLVRQLASGKAPSHPVLETPGWWRRAERLTTRPLATENSVAPRGAGEKSLGDDAAPPGQSSDRSSPDCDLAENRLVGRPSSTPGRQQHAPAAATRPVLITGATGTLGRAFGRICQGRGIVHRLVSRQEMDIAEPESVQGVMDELQPWAIINTAGYVRVDDAESDVERCMRENAFGPEVLARACAARATQLVTFSSDLVFDGAKDSAYLESDPVAPLSVYGRSKSEAEWRVLAVDPTALIVRTSAFFGPWDSHNFVYAALRTLGAGRPFLAASDNLISPTYVPDLVHTTLDLLLDREAGLWHVVNDGGVTWADLAQLVASQAGVCTDSLASVPSVELSLPARRPRASVLRSERGWVMPELEDAVARFLADSEVPWGLANP